MKKMIAALVSVMSIGLLSAASTASSPPSAPVDEMKEEMNECPACGCDCLADGGRCCGFGNFGCCGGGG